MIVRDFNKIEIKGDKLLKTFIGPDNLAYTMADEISYYRELPHPVKGLGFVGHYKKSLLRCFSLNEF